ncbi:MAG: glycosyltransferase [Pegethrix bostrychoides GSE-TBD4-15B]|jgi:glycosyltransferase involved in cell wall biosynthesis|uniref:Glycosyltransferase n=1 Tax=Pegethrix bostrychoides GSE-TBD4-15B TaxID=2839662 RepID=A0A951P8C8_9CYAN|nr:glycosyltransferase [Pegethrix bostrychoides GSE-TBD4-15B]
MARRQKVCIITPDIIGPIKNGGIGTHCFYLAKFLAQEMQQDVTVVFTGPFEIGSVDSWRKYYLSEFSIQFISEAELSPLFYGHGHGGKWFILRSQKVYHWLKDQDFDVCYFQEWHANGFISIQAKRTGLALHHTKLVCMAHSSSQWIREGMQLFPTQQADDLILDYAERYCMEFADYALSPSQAMFDWARNSGWVIAEQNAVIPYLFEHSINSVRANFAGNHLIFFGRLETRKGLEVFLKALQRLAPELRASARTLRVSFLGKNGTTQYGEGNRTIETLLADYTDVYRHEIFNQLAQAEALKFLTDHASALVVTPSLVDNLPFAVLECLELGINIIAANTGGIPEMFADHARLFTPTVKSLTVKLRECLFTGLPPLQKRFSIENSRQLWRDFCEQVAVDTPKISTGSALNQSSEQPLVSICIPHYNCGQYLPDALASLKKQTYKNFEVIVVDDGSTEQKSLEAFDRLTEHYCDSGWLFLKKENGGPGSARNLAVSKSGGQYIVFLDSDNAAEPDMLAKMVHCMQTSKLDCLSCYYRIFDEYLPPSANLYKFACFMTGPCLEASIYDNVLGDTNFIVKASVFSELGGFKERSDVNHEDRELLANLVVQGYSMDVIPAFLFRYRLRAEGFNRITSSYSNQMVGISPLLETLPWWSRRFLVNAIGTLLNPTLLNQLHAQQVAALPVAVSSPSQQVGTKELRAKLKGARAELTKTKSELSLTQDQLIQAQNRINAMETSKFWLLRKGWFKLKKRLNLPVNE